MCGDVGGGGVGGGGEEGKGRPLDPFDKPNGGGRRGRVLSGCFRAASE